MEMKSSAQDVLSSFDRLSPAEQLIVTREIAKRLKHSELGLEGGALDDEELTSLTDLMFQMYDREEERNGLP